LIFINKSGEKLDRDVNAAVNMKNIAFDKQNLVGV
jgi:transposase